MRILKFILPLIIFVGLAFFLYRGLSKDPSLVPSPLINKPVPLFSLPQLDGTGNWSPKDYRGKVWLLNIWASWCASCLTEHPLLNTLAKNKTVPIVGFAWKDKPENSTHWLKRHGNPYTIVVSDLVGTSAIDLGVYGAPETYLIDKRGMIRYKKIGAFAPQDLTDPLLPLIKQLNAE